METKLIAVIRISGKIGLNRKIKDTFNMLKLYKKHSCVVVPNKPTFIGMITKIKDHVTWGEVNESALDELIKKRARTPGNKPLTEEYVKDKANLTLSKLIHDLFSCKIQLKDIPGCKQFFKLTPPRGGYEKLGTKKPYSLGGALGYRKDKINELIIKMV